MATHLARYTRRPGTVVLGLVRGGVPVAQRVAQILGARLDVMVVRKLGLPWAPEVAFGALGPGGVRVLNPTIASRLRVNELDTVTERESAELARRERLYRQGRPPLDLTGRTAIIVDDGLATGATARAAVAVARELGATRVVLAVPAGAADAVAALTEDADEVVCPVIPRTFRSVSDCYDHFGQVDDGYVVAALTEAVAAAT